VSGQESEVIMQGNGLSTTIYIEKVRRERMKLKMERKH
jgi:hypothetical protein